MGWYVRFLIGQILSPARAKIVPTTNKKHGDTSCSAILSPKAIMKIMNVVKKS